MENPGKSIDYIRISTDIHDGFYLSMDIIEIVYGEAMNINGHPWIFKGYPKIPLENPFVSMDFPKGREVIFLRCDCFLVNYLFDFAWHVSEIGGGFQGDVAELRVEQIACLARVWMIA